MIPERCGRGRPIRIAEAPAVYVGPGPVSRSMRRTRLGVVRAERRPVVAVWTRGGGVIVWVLCGHPRRRRRAARPVGAVLAGGPQGIGHSSRDGRAGRWTPCSASHWCRRPRARALARLADERGLTLTPANLESFRARIERDRRLFGDCVTELDPASLEPVVGRIGRPNPGAGPLPGARDQGPRHPEDAGDGRSPRSSAGSASARCRSSAGPLSPEARTLCDRTPTRRAAQLRSARLEVMRSAP